MPETATSGGSVSGIGCGFSAGDARQRAIRYADREYGTYDKIELELYARADEPEVT
jgi:hypothetical protein